MKKFFLSAISICLVSIFIFNCKLHVQDKDTLDRPEIINTSTGVGITITRYSQDTSYINIYRRDVTSTSPDKATAINIGVLFPSSYNKSDKTYFIEDLILLKNHKYQYMVRYCEPEGYSYTDWTDTISIPSSAGYDESTKLSYSSTSCKFRYNQDNSILTLVGTLTTPGISGFSSNWRPALVVSNNEKTVVFELTSASDGDQINLRKNLPPDFLDKEIKIEGIVGQRKIKTSENQTQKDKLIFWTPILSLKIQGYGGNIIEVKSESGSTGYDYSS